MITKTSIGFLTTDPDKTFIVNCRTATAGILANSAKFVDPQPPLATVNAGIDAMEVAVNDAAGGGKELTALKNAKRAEVVSLMRQLASYVTVTSNGDLATLLSSGFPIQKPTRSPVGVLPAPVTPALRLGVRTGELNGSVPPLNGSYTYNWRVALASAPTVYVLTLQTTAASVVLPGLTPGQIYNVEANAVGSAGPSDWSDAASKMVV